MEHNGSQFDKKASPLTTKKVSSPMSNYEIALRSAPDRNPHKITEILEQVRRPSNQQSG